MIAMIQFDGICHRRTDVMLTTGNAEIPEGSPGARSGSLQEARSRSPSSRRPLRLQRHGPLPLGVAVSMACCDDKPSAAEL
jgi:hypothetical protein